LIWQVLARPARRTKPRIPDDTRIYAIGDVHGRVDLLNEMFAAIEASLIKFPVGNPIQVLVGDYIDRGPNSRDVIEALIARAREHQMVYLKGNHESYALQFLSDPSLLAEWSEVGGVNTLMSYGVNPSLKQNAEEQRKVADAFCAALLPSHLGFMQDLALTYSCGDYFFTHAGVRPGVPLAQQSEQDLLWIRDDFLLHEEDFGKIIVHGHTPAKMPEVRANRINIDTGAFATGRLTCLVLQADDMAVI
jgi:serine/threonine protein phosphatase 1